MAYSSGSQFVFRLRQRQDTKQFAAMGFGTSTCTQFANQYKSDPQWAETNYFTWAQGFMSGWNMAQVAAKQPTVNLAAMSAAMQQQDIRSYCDQHPLASFIHATLNLLATLRLQAGRP